MIIPVILSGGSGTRLWPLSREHYPKQMLKLGGNGTLLQAAATRLNGMPFGPDNALQSPIVVCNEEHRFMVAEQLREAGVTPAAMMLEPCGCNTAPALTLAALTACSEQEDPILVVMPADQVIGNPQAFHQAVLVAMPLAETGRLVAFGIKPSRPETGFGYIRIGTPLPASRAGSETVPAFAVAEFVEKPNKETAEHYLAGGAYLWNGGIFVMKASVWLRKIEQYRPDIAAACRTAFQSRQQDQDFIRPDKASFAACPSDSIDYAVMERLASSDEAGDDLAVVPLDAQWSDLGAWGTVWEIADKDAQRNVLLGDVMAIDTKDTLAIADGRLVACVGLTDIVIVDTPDAVLVAHKDHLQQVKDIVFRLNQEGRSEPILHRKVYRPWGWYDTIDIGPRFKVKRILVNPGASLSLQMHHHRAEHWVVVCGTAKATRGDEVLLLSENQSTYIPVGIRHRLENPGHVPLEIVEVQSGAYLEEDDIVRLEDLYGRGQQPP